MAACPTPFAYVCGTDICEKDGVKPKSNATRYAKNIKPCPDGFEHLKYVGYASGLGYDLNRSVCIAPRPKDTETDPTKIGILCALKKRHPFHCPPDICGPNSTKGNQILTDICKMNDKVFTDSTCMDWKNIDKDGYTEVLRNICKNQLYTAKQECKDLKQSDDYDKANGTADDDDNKPGSTGTPSTGGSSSSKAAGQGLLVIFILLIGLAVLVFVMKRRSASQIQPMQTQYYPQQPMQPEYYPQPQAPNYPQQSIQAQSSMPVI